MSRNAFLLEGRQSDHAYKCTAVIQLLCNARLTDSIISPAALISATSTHAGSESVITRIFLDFLDGYGRVGVEPEPRSVKVS